MKVKNLKKLKKSAKKNKRIKPKRIKKNGTISRKKRMKNEIFIAFLIASMLIRKNCYNTI